MIQLDEFLSLINKRYLDNYNTKLVAGFDEPFYQASKPGKPAEIQFSHDYFRSALHELAHWCVAGVERRRKDDYGYWYAADGRDQKQQDEFFKLEVKPQAIEWAFSIVCEVGFEASVDNLNNQVEGVDTFKKDLSSQLQFYLNNGFSKRVGEILVLLAQYQNIASVEEFIRKAID